MRKLGCEVNEPMRLLDGLLMIAARTPRSQAYVQAMAHAGIAPANVLLFGRYGLPRVLDTPSQQKMKTSVLLPDLSVPIEQTCVESGWNMVDVPVEDVNAPELVRVVNELRPELAIYAGFGGHIVGSALVSAPFPILHMHPGWLPNFRGSTTMYYSWLKAQECAVSAFVMAAGIDKGAIVARRRYPIPPRGVDADHIYDNAIRADLLIRVLGMYERTGSVDPIETQESDDEMNYFIIHPVLKHLALEHQNARPLSNNKKRSVNRHDDRTQY